MCAGCDKKTLEKAAEALKAEEPKSYPPPRLAMTCPGCGLKRLLPTGLNVNDTFELVPCPKCANTFKGQFVGNGVQELIDE